MANNIFNNTDSSHSFVNTVNLFFDCSYHDFLDSVFGDGNNKDNYICSACSDIHNCGKDCQCRCHVKSCLECDKVNCNYKNCSCQCHV